MTNIIGAALVVLSMNVSTNYYTNQVSITCTEAGCTNKPEMTEIVAGIRADGSLIITNETKKACWSAHYRPEVVPWYEATEIVVGAKAPYRVIVNHSDNRTAWVETRYNNIPLFRICRHRVFYDGWVDWQRASEGMRVLPIEEKK